MNSFYEKSIAIQWSVGILMLLILFAGFVLWMSTLATHFVVVPLILIIPSAVQFLATPAAKLAGPYSYLSPMLVVFAPSEKKYDIHNGTPFDYLLVMKGVKSGAAFNRTMIKYYLEGLLRIVEKVEAKELPDSVVICGSSYFFSDRTARRLGFELSEASLALKLNVLINYVDLVWMYSLSRGRLAFPKLGNMKTARISGKRLVQNKAELVRLKTRLDRNG